MRPELISQPITGICSFGRYPICLDLDELKADFGVLGVPYDLGVGFLSGARMGPRRIREASRSLGVDVLFGFIEREGETLYSSCMLVERGGIACCYRRMSRGWKDCRRTDSRLALHERTDAGSV